MSHAALQVAENFSENAFSVHRQNVCPPPIHCRRRPLVIYITNVQHMASPAKLSRIQERLDASYVTDLRTLVFAFMYCTAKRDIVNL